MNQGNVVSVDSLIANVSRTKELVEVHVRNQNEYNSYHSPISMKWWVHLILIHITAPIFTAIISPLLMMSESFAILVFAWMLVGYPLSYKYIKKKLLNKKMNKNKGRINELQEQNDDIYNELREFSIVPEAYWNTYALPNIESYLMNKRADDLKEALNLFEQERRHNEQMQEIYHIQEMTAAAYDKADDATTVGWFNLFRK